MSALDTVRVVTAREIRTRVDDRAFRISTVVTLVAVVALAVLPGLLGGDPSAWRIGATGDLAEAGAQRVLPVMPENRDATVERIEGADAERAVREGDLTVVLADDGSLLGDESVNDELAALLQAGWQQENLVQALLAEGVPTAEAERLATTPPGTVRLLDPPDEERDRHIGFAVVGVVLLYAQLLGYGLWVASGVVEEKSSRVVEVLLAKVPARQLLTGKVVGIGVVGLGQLALIVLVGFAAFLVSDRFPLPDGVALSALGLLGWFVLGYLLYAAVFAVAGALSARAEDLQSTAGPFNLVVVLSFLGAMTASGDPDGTLARVLAYVPTTSVMVMPIRTAAGEASWVEIVLSVAITLAAAVALVRLADVVYRRAALRTGSRVRLREVLRRSAA